MEKNEIIKRNENLLKTLDDSGWLIKSAYMITMLKPDDLTHYVIFEEDEPTTFQYEGKDIHIKKGHILHETDSRVPWETIQGKYRHLTNKEFFKHICVGYISKAALVLFSEKDTYYDDTFDKDNLINGELVKTILEPFDCNVYFELADFEKLKYFVENDEDVVAYFNRSKDIRELAITWNAINKVPASLILFYLIKKHQSELIENWPFSSSELRELLKIMNISDDVL